MANQVIAETPAQMDILREALQVMVDVTADNVFDNFPRNAKAFRMMAEMTDDELDGHLTEALETLSMRIERAKAAKELMAQLDQL